MKPHIDLAGQRFGRLVAVKYLGATKEKAMWKLKCDCGSIITARANNLRTGTTRSCGCLKREVSTEKATKHGLHGVPEYGVWKSMNQRCSNPKNPGFKNYGGRGITVCRAWATSFANFYADMGPRPSPELTIKRTTKLSHALVMDLRARSKGKTVRDWAREHGIKETAAYCAANYQTWNDDHA